MRVLGKSFDRQSVQKCPDFYFSSTESITQFLLIHRLLGWSSSHFCGFASVYDDPASPFRAARGVWVIRMTYLVSMLLITEFYNLRKWVGNM